MSLTEEPAPQLDADPLLADLTGPQREAVMHTEGPVLVVAAAGSGKTRTITRRIAHLVRCGIPPWSILALTFTNKAAAEMRSRVLELLDEDSRATRGLTVTTFHSLCARLMRRYAEVAGLAVKGDFTIYDSGDQAALVKRVLEAMQLSSTNWPPRTVLAAISNAKNELQDAAAYGAHAADFYTKTIAKVYAGYESALRKANAVDFDDLLLLTARMLKENGQIRSECNQRWQYLQIDEYQDTNRAQFVIASLLAGAVPPAKPNICVVGDPDQAIYGWRGADITNILDFERQYPGCRVILLGENFRSTAPILNAADTLIRHNQKRKHKDLFTRRPGGEKVQVVLCQNERHEATLAVDWFRSLHGAGEGPDQDREASGGFAWRDMAVFYRTNALSRVMEDGLRAAGIPYVIARGTAFYEREEVKSALAYLRVVANPADEVSLSRIINTPARGIGDASLNAVEVFAAQHGLPFFDALRQAARIEGISARARGSIQRFVELIDQWTGSGSFMGAGVSGTLADLVERIIKESGLEKMYADQAKAAKSETDLERMDNLDELVSSARQFEMEYDPSGDPGVPILAGASEVETPPPPLLSLLRGYLESVSLVADADAVDPSQGAVTLMTLHAAKGLEFGAVAMIGLEEGLLPHSRARESDAALEEERRLCFVGITRAMRKLQISSAKYRTMRGMTERTIPSRFLGEMGNDQVIISDQSDALANLEGTAWGGDDLSEADRGAAGAVRASMDRAAAARTSAKFPVGAMVRHPQFGVGKVLSITSGNNARAQIQFRDVGTKTLVLEYARLERLSV